MSDIPFTDKINPKFISILETEVKFYTAGKIANYYHLWKKLTSDKFILDIVRTGLKIEFFKLPATQYSFHEIKLKENEVLAIDDEIGKLLLKGVIKKCFKEENDFISSVFTRDKADGTLRMILNLKKLNQHVTYNHFKMESLKNVLDIIQPGAWMASVDLKDAFYSIPVNANFQKYLKFQWKNEYYKYVSMPNGYGEAMRIFTKVMKVPFSFLRKKGLLSVIFVDDTYLQGNSYQDCLENVQQTIATLRNLGFTIHVGKSVLKPTQQIEFLGFILNSVTMTVSLSKRKTEHIKSKINTLLSKSIITITELASVIGTLVSALPAAPLGRLHYRSLEMLKIEQLLLSRGNYTAKICELPSLVIKDLHWWLENIDISAQNIIKPKVDLILETDASEAGWGANDGNTPIGGRWETISNQHINYLELKAIYYGLRAYLKVHLNKEHIQIMCDNTTAVAYINNMGGTRSKLCNAITTVIWSMCIAKGIWISASHIPGRNNNTADCMSRKFNENKEWKLSPVIFRKITKTLDFSPNVDLFASHLNYQISEFVSWLPDPGAMAIDAFSISWQQYLIYAFPPFSLLGLVMRKIIQETATGIIIMPVWPTQYWYPVIGHRLISLPLLLPKDQKILTLPGKETMLHPLLPKLRLAAALVSGDLSKVKTFQAKLMKSFFNHGESPHLKNMNLCLDDGINFAVKGMKIPFIQI